MKRVALLLCLSSFAFADQITIPNPLSNNSVADAIAVQENFDTLLAESNENDSRITALEFGGDRDAISVDCAEDPAALQSAFSGRTGDGPGLFFEITGVCELDFLSLGRDIRILGVSDGAKIVPSEFAANSYGFLFVFSSYGDWLQLSNLSLKDAYITAIRNGSISLNNVSYEGQLNGVNAETGGVLRLYGAANSESGFVRLSAKFGGVAHLTNANGSFDIIGGTNGTVLCSPCVAETTITSVNLKGGSTFCARIPQGTERTIPVVQAEWNSNVLVEGGGTLIVDNELIDASSVFNPYGNSC